MVNSVVILGDFLVYERTSTFLNIKILTNAK